MMEIVQMMETVIGNRYRYRPALEPKWECRDSEMKEHEEEEENEEEDEEDEEEGEGRGGGGE
jgi:hypothetical protein